ncbi:TetR/AcrR family transcriptional regulator [Actinocorallia sp. B10E7]|uniref:TetR/AcrR family transcriptional regulator n=1 Tax=Actinocorallia sp. B10E7 TaxID=3153558 RepID=UPI00325DD330
MPTTSAGRGRAGRTQEERSAATREALLEATVAVLAEEGYAGLTTTKVAARAGVTRGAQVHHFPSRDALVAAAISHLVERTADDMAKILSDRPDLLTVEGLLDLLWELFRGPVFQAVLQFVAASPPEPEIRQSLMRLDQTITRLMLEHASAFFGDHHHPDSDDRLFVAFNAISGLALNYRFVRFDDALLAARWERTRAQLVRLLTLP